MIAINDKAFPWLAWKFKSSSFFSFFFVQKIFRNHEKFLYQIVNKKLVSLKVNIWSNIKTVRAVVMTRFMYVFKLLTYGH